MRQGHPIEGKGDSVDDSDRMLFQRQLDTLQEEFRLFRERDEKRWDHLIQMQEANQEMTKQNAANIAALTEATKGVVEIYNTTAHVAKAGTAAGRFAKWLAGMGAFGAIITAVIVWISEHWPS